MCATCGQWTSLAAHVWLTCCRSCAISHQVGPMRTPYNELPNFCGPSLPLLPSGSGLPTNPLRHLGMTYRRAQVRPAQLRPTTTRPSASRQTSSMTHSYSTHSSSTEETSSEAEEESSSSVDWEMEERRAEFGLPHKKAPTKARK